MKFTAMWLFIVGIVTLPYLVAGQCNYDQKCWFTAIGCTITKGNPFERRAFISCDECMQLCLQRKDGPPPYCCKAIVYDTQWKFCDLFAVQAQSKADFVRYPGRVYLSPSGNCTVTSAPVVDCPAGQKAVISIYQNSTNPALSGGTPVSADSAEKCGLLCAQNKDDKGNPFQCKAAAFSQGTCTFSDKDPGPNSAQNLKPGTDPNALYFEKKCYPGDVAGSCSTVLLDPHHVLVGYNRKTVDAASYDQCLQQCLSAKQNFQFTCNSGQYYADVQKDNCILNEETSETKPDVYIATDDNNIYFQPECSNRKLIYSMRRSRARLYMRDVAVEKDKELRWSDWSSCNKTTNLKYRFSNCYKERPQECPKQIKTCDYVDTVESNHKKLPCKPLIKNKKPDCQYGVREGSPREYGCKPDTPECFNSMHYS